MKKSAGHELVLIPWHIGNRLDVTLAGVSALRRLRCFLAEDPGLSRRQFAPFLGAAASGKTFLRIPDSPDPAFLKTVEGLLRGEDVGLVSGGGIPCFVDPGAWVVRELRRKGAAVRALAGASALSTVLSLSGLEWGLPPNHFFTFVFFSDQREKDGIRRALGRAGEPVVVFLRVFHLRACLRAVAEAGAERLVSVFCDLTKVPKERYPCADEVRTMSCRAWLADLSRKRWAKVSDVVLLVHPAEGQR